MTAVLCHWQRKRSAKLNQKYQLSDIKLRFLFDFKKFRHARYLQATATFKIIKYLVIKKVPLLVRLMANYYGALHSPERSFHGFFILNKLM